MTISVLIVEDDQEKLRRVTKCLQDALSTEAHEIENARDTISAKARLRERRYDLLILDISLPNRPEDSPSQSGGIHLLNEVVDRSELYNIPQHIIGLTAYADLRELAATTFEEELWQIVQYDASSDNWMRQIQRRVRHIALAARPGQPQKTFDVDLCVVTALHKPELSAVLNLDWSWELYEESDDSTIYHKGVVRRRNGNGTVVAAAAERMGMTASAILATKMIMRFRPRYLAMVGITGGVRGRCQLGDVIVADPCWDWGSGRWQTDGSGRVFAASPHQVGLDASMRGKLALMATTQSCLDDIKANWRGAKPANSLQMHIGPAASGAAVLADSLTTEEIKRHHRKLIGVDMEAYAVLAAAQEAAFPAPKGFVIKGVSDFADDEKNDDLQEYAAFTSVQALRALVERFL